MPVNQDDGSGSRSDGGCKHLSGMDQRCSEDALTDQHLTLDEVLRVQEDAPELLNLEVAKASLVSLEDLGTGLQATAELKARLGQTAGELERASKPACCPRR